MSRTCPSYGTCPGCGGAVGVVDARLEEFEERVDELERELEFANAELERVRKLAGDNYHACNEEIRKHLP